MTGKGSVLDLELVTSTAPGLLSLSELTHQLTRVSTPGLTQAPPGSPEHWHNYVFQTKWGGPIANTSVRESPQQKSKHLVETLPRVLVSFVDPELLSNKRAPGLGYSFKKHYCLKANGRTR